MSSVAQPLPSSYRDESGFIFASSSIYKRAITERGLADYEYYIRSGLHGELVRLGLVLQHAEEAPPPDSTGIAKVLVPEQLRFVSYPYEWSFDELKDAALLTLVIAEHAFARGMALKDASAYNVQFRGSKAVFIDTLSFERDPGGPWAAYEQFCRHFLGPLLVMSYLSSDANRYLRVDIDGFPLRQISKWLPRKSYLRPGCLLHIHFHALAARMKPYAGRARNHGGAASGPNLVRSLRRAVERIKSPAYPPAWANYYEESRFYSAQAADSKRKQVQELVETVRPSLVFDLGANTGVFSALAAQTGAFCIAFDSDAACINRLYLREREKCDSRILPLVIDVANPSPPLGFGLGATLSLFDRARADLVMCLALLHHLRVTGNLPLRRIAEFLARLGRWLLIEFVPRDDQAVQFLTQRQDSFTDYTMAGFLEAFTGCYELRRQSPLIDSRRELFLFERRR